MQKRIADFGVRIGRMPKGRLNKITDVPGVRVGHCTLDTDRLKTGVTVLLPGPENLYYHKMAAGAHVLNGYGKSAGLTQVGELGTLETPIALTNTLNVGLVQDAMVELVLERCHAEGRYPTSINPVVCECHDGTLSDIVQRPVKLAHVRQAAEAATEDFAEGAVGAGRGMICHGFKGGIGSASRLVTLEGETYTLGLLAMTNHGRMEDFLLEGRPVGKDFAEKLSPEAKPERGSVIVLVATDLPLSDRQLGRVLRRAPVGLARLGSYIGHGSGEIMLGFTTANRMPHEEGPALRTHRVLREDLLDEAFRAVAECCEEAALNSMICAETTTGYRGNVAHSLREMLGW